jgi:NADH dehydrogenase
MAQTDAHRIVIVGGGAGGLELATRLGRRLGRKGRAAITLVDSNLVHVWKPLYHEVAAGTLDSQEDAVTFIAQAFRNDFQFHYGRMQGLDRERKEVLLGPLHDSDGVEVVPAGRLPYDALVICVGSVSNHFGIPGAAEHCLHLDTLQQAEDFHQRLVRLLLRAQADRQRLVPLHVAIIGGGATGVELAAELRSAARRAAHYGFGKIDPERDLKLTIIEAAPRLLPPLSPRLAAKAESHLREIGVEVLTGERVSEVTADAIHTQGGRAIAAQIKVWAAGIKAPDWLSTLGLETSRSNQLVVKESLQTTSDDSIFAFGDCARAPQPDSEHPVPPRAQAAHQQALFLTKALERHMRGESPGRFVFQDYGSLISLSEDNAVGRLMGNLFGSASSLNIEGMLARMAYSSLYQRHLTALYGPIRTMVLWLARRLTRPVRLRLKLH